MPRKIPKKRGRQVTPGKAPERDPKKYADFLRRKKETEAGQQAQEQRQARQAGRKRRTTTARRNETFANIAEEQNITVDALLAANPDVGRLRPGMALKLPTPKPQQNAFIDLAGGQKDPALMQLMQQHTVEERRELAGRGVGRQGYAQVPEDYQPGPGPSQPGGTAAGRAALAPGGRPPSVRPKGYAGTRGRFRTSTRPESIYKQVQTMVADAGGDMGNIVPKYGPYVPVGPPGPEGGPPVAPFLTYNEVVAQGEGVFGSFVLEDILDAGGLPLRMTTNQALTLGLDADLMGEYYVIDDWGNWKLRTDVEEEEGSGYGGYGQLQRSYGYGGGGGGGGGRNLSASPDWLKDSPYDDGLTSWSIK